MNPCPWYGTDAAQAIPVERGTQPSGVGHPAVQATPGSAASEQHLCWEGSPGPPRQREVPLTGSRERVGTHLRQHAQGSSRGRRAATSGLAALRAAPAGNRSTASPQPSSDLLGSRTGRAGVSWFQLNLAGLQEQSSHSRQGRGEAYLCSDGPTAAAT